MIAFLLKILLMNGFKTYFGTALLLIASLVQAWLGEWVQALPMAAVSLIAAGLRHALSKLGRATVGRSV